jgi:hypothetical protein
MGQYFTHLSCQRLCFMANRVPGQCLLGYRSTHSGWHAQGSAHPHRPVGLEDPVRGPGKCTCYPSHGRKADRPQWAWPVPLFLVAFFAPESPWWLVRKGRVDEAKRNLRRLTSGSDGSDFNLEQTVAMMEHTHHIEQEVCDCDITYPHVHVLILPLRALPGRHTLIASREPTCAAPRSLPGVGSSKPSVAVPS